MVVVTCSWDLLSDFHISRKSAKTQSVAHFMFYRMKNVDECVNESDSKNAVESGAFAKVPLVFFK